MKFAASAARGREIAALVDSETPVAVPTTVDGGSMAAYYFSLPAGWGHFGQGVAVMPGHGLLVERPYAAAERAALASTPSILGGTTLDIHLNDRAC